MIYALRLSAIKALLYVPTLGLLTACAISQGTIRDGEYTSPNGMFTVQVPKPSNWAGVPYSITVLDNHGDNQYDKVMFHVGDFGEYLVVGARVVPANSVSAMDRDDNRTVLRNLSEASLMGWRGDFSALPEISEESFFDSKYGEAILRVYRAKKGSFLARAQGRRPTPDDVFDTNIASIVARQGLLVVFVLAQDDSLPDSTQVVKEKADQMFRDMKLRQVQ
jgi:hypothetical protein